MNTDFLEQLASSSPTPGGGGACAYVGALGSALASMVGNLTVGKPAYASVEPEIARSLEKLHSLRQTLLRLVEEDEKAFAPLARAYGLPRQSEEEKELRTAAIQEGLVRASIVPLQIMKTCSEVIIECELMANKGSKMVLSDAGVGVMFAQAALKAASLNVFINTASMQDKREACDFNSQANALLEKYIKRSDEIFEFVRNKIG